MDGRFPERIRPGNIWSGGLLGGLISNDLERVAGVTGAPILIAALILSVLVYAFGQRFLVQESCFLMNLLMLIPMSSDELMSLEQPEERKGVFAFLKDGLERKAMRAGRRHVTRCIVQCLRPHLAANDSDVPAIEASNI